jgi:hypothetical protein
LRPAALVALWGGCGRSGGSADDAGRDAPMDFGTVAGGGSTGGVSGSGGGGTGGAAGASNGGGGEGATGSARSTRPFTKNG